MIQFQSDSSTGVGVRRLLNPLRKSLRIQLSTLYSFRKAVMNRYFSLAIVVILCPFSILTLPDLNKRCVSDLLILLDSSASVEQEFDKEKDILITLLADGNILKHDIMISVFQYNEVVTQVTSRFENLVDSLTTGLSVKIKDLHNSAGSTNTLEALKAAYWEFKNFGRPDANRILLLITDGRSQNPLESLSEAAGALLKLKVEIFAATASHNPDLSELLLYTQDRNRLFQADDSAAVVPAISSAISRGKCPESDDPRNITVFPTAQLINTTVHSTTTEGIISIPLFLRVLQRGTKVLVWAPVYVEPANTPNIFTSFKNGMDETIGNSTLADSYSHLEVVQLLNPKLFNEEWDRGLIFQFVVKLKNSKASQKPSEIWDVLLNSIRANHNQIGQSDLYISYGQPNQEMPLKSTTSQLL